MSQGSLKTTNGALDLAVTGLGFFQVVNENALIPFFTRMVHLISLQQAK